jgi:uncharacterized integral membrane protein
MAIGIYSRVRKSAVRQLIMNPLKSRCKSASVPLDAIADPINGWPWNSFALELLRIKAFQCRRAVGITANVASIDVSDLNNGGRKSASWRAWVVGALVTLVMIVALQNSQEVRVDILFVTVDAPLIVILIVAVTVGASIGCIAPLVLRHRREERQPRSADS